MKHYPKKYQNITNQPEDRLLDKIGSNYGSVDELIVSLRTFYRESTLQIFDIFIKQTWISQQFLYNGVRRARIAGTSTQEGEIVYSFFMRAVVGSDKNALASSLFLPSILTYLKDFFPNFSDHNPFTESDYFKYPYKNITLDYLYLVHDHDDRLEMLKKAEEESMSFYEFYNWVINHVLCYNEEKEEQVYEIYFNVAGGATCVRKSKEPRAKRKIFYETYRTKKAKTGGVYE